MFSLWGSLENFNLTWKVESWPSEFPFIKKAVMGGSLEVSLSRHRKKNSQRRDRILRYFCFARDSGNFLHILGRFPY